VEACGKQAQKMEATCSSKMSVDFQRTTWRYIPEDRISHNLRCENLKSSKTMMFNLKSENDYMTDPWLYEFHVGAGGEREEFSLRNLV
jgi:hypothetical protein